MNPADISSLSFEVDNQVFISRSPLKQDDFDELYLNREDIPQTKLKDKIKSNLYCSRRRFWKLLSSYIPVIKSIRYYKPKEWAVYDIVAGLTVGILHIPQALAFIHLTSVKDENGLYTSLWPVLIYAVFGTSPYVSIGTSAVIFMLTAAVVERESNAWAADKAWILKKVTNGTTLDQVSEYLDFKEEVAMSIALISGLMMLAMGFLKLGFITACLSQPFFTAFTSGAAVHVGTSQLAAMLGITVMKYSGTFKLIETYKAIFSVIGDVNLAAIVCAIITLVWLVKDCFNERLKQKMFAPIPVELCLVIVFTMVSYFCHLRQHFSLSVVGAISAQIHPPFLPQQGLKLGVNHLIDCFVIAILIYANTMSMAKPCVLKNNSEVNESQEILSYGMYNAISSFLHCFPSSVAPPRAMAASSMNVKSTLNGFISFLVVLFLILFIAPVLKELPKSVLAALIFASLKSLFIQIAALRKYWKIN